jgi:hypothetical protein
MKRLFVLVFFLLTTLQLLAQTQYDYYDDKNVYGGVDSAIGGLTILGIIILVIVAIVIIGGMWAKTMDFFKPPQKNKPLNTQEKTVVNSLKSSEKKEDISRPKEQMRTVVITIAGKIIEAEVTMNDNSKKTEWFWYEINNVYYDFTENITFSKGDDIVKPAGSVQGGKQVNREDVRIETKTIFKCYNSLRINGKFDPRKLQFVRIDGLGIYDRWVYYYDGEAHMQSIISEKEAVEIASA